MISAEAWHAAPEELESLLFSLGFFGGVRLRRLGVEFGAAFSQGVFVRFRY
jgi:hypothetical protein